MDFWVASEEFEGCEPVADAVVNRGGGNDCCFRDSQQMPCDVQSGKPDGGCPKETSGNAWPEHAL